MRALPPGHLRGNAATTAAARVPTHILPSAERPVSLETFSPLLGKGFHFRAGFPDDGAIAGGATAQDARRGPQPTAEGKSKKQVFDFRAREQFSGRTSAPGKHKAPYFQNSQENRIQYLVNHKHADIYDAVSFLPFCITNTIFCICGHQKWTSNFYFDCLIFGAI